MVEYFCVSCQNQICVNRCSRSAVVIPSKYVGRPQTDYEPDLLKGLENAVLTIGKSLYDAPSCGWSHDLIERYAAAYANRHQSEAWDIYLGSQWVGSSEI